ncbi:polysaccharide deacetylase family protein [Dasania sp. GY-MA-18]|nr:MULTISPECIES: polysaccharide deacetylase family protein [Dasania]MCR8924107.1 polysaccharide deacetylase family protein [Dasania sp. GY-MA-18]
MDKNKSLAMFSVNQPIALPAEQPPQLIVVIDTEEEFDWGAGPDRSKTSVSAMQHIDRVQNIFDQYGIVPCYVVDYPVVSQAQGVALLRQYHSEGRCEIGAHLHPWVTPPYDEEVSAFNSYAGNLPAELERKKLQAMVDKITEVFAKRPTIYKAGRYGLGSNSSAIMEQLGFEVDVSVCPPVDYRADGGPDYSRAHAQPFWFGSDNGLLELPVTGAFVGWAGALQRPLYNMAGKLQKFKAKGILSRLSAVDRLMLSPEGFSSQEHIKLTEYLLKRGVRTFTWSFHSTSVKPGMAPYVKTEQDLAEFLDSFRRYFDYFFTQLKGEATTPSLLKQKLESYR